MKQICFGTILKQNKFTILSQQVDFASSIKKNTVVFLFRC